MTFISYIISILISLGVFNSADDYDNLSTAEQQQYQEQYHQQYQTEQDIIIEDWDTN